MLEAMQGGKNQQTDMYNVRVQEKWMKNCNAYNQPEDDNWQQYFP